MVKFNTTQLNPDKTFEKHVYHRDQFAHYLRWTHILKNAKIGMNILDFGAGTGNLLEVLYRNRYKGEEYLGLEYRISAVKEANRKFIGVDWARFEQADLTVPGLSFEPLDKRGWDMIACFEVIEHIGKKNVPVFLQNIFNCMTPNKTKLYLSTPVYDATVGPAANHIVDGVIGEMTYNELKDHLVSTGFKIEKVYGTFASIRDYDYLLNDWQKEMFRALQDYYDTSLLSVIMAPFFPEQSRNCLWRCSI
jgi:cyclopropane fatty-acyl-phospholipid synthase-like methyltransferase